MKENSNKKLDITGKKDLPIDGDVGGQVFGDGVYLSGRMPKVLISPLAKFPILWLMVFDPSDTSKTWMEKNYLKLEKTKKH